jgi:uncharacterized protein YkwD
MDFFAGAGPQILTQVIISVTDYFQHLFARYHVNLLDFLLIIIVIFYAYEGYVLGLFLATIDLLSFVLSFIIALKFYTLLAHVFVFLFSLPIGFANAAGFFLLAFILEIALNIILRRLLSLVPRLNPARKISHTFKKFDHILGVIPGVVSAFIVLSFLLSVIVSLPSSPIIKQVVTGSRLGSRLIANTSIFEKQLNQVFGGALNETLNFLTVEPKSNELVSLHFKITSGTIDEQAEQDMFKMVNNERTRAGLDPLVFDDTLRDVARTHSQDMFARGYFSHYTPEGLSPFDRMNNADISYTYAGENLALAPSTQLAMEGLMNSPGHRANILNPNFKRIGIGVVDGGIYGQMYSQEFTN